MRLARLRRFVTSYTDYRRETSNRKNSRVTDIMTSLDLSRLLAIAGLFQAFHYSLLSTARTEDPGVPLPTVTAGTDAVSKAFRADNLPVSGTWDSGNKVLRIRSVLSEL